MDGVDFFQLRCGQGGKALIDNDNTEIEQLLHQANATSSAQLKIEIQVEKDRIHNQFTRDGYADMLVEVDKHGGVAWMEMQGADDGVCKDLFGGFILASAFAQIELLQYEVVYKSGLK